MSVTRRIPVMSKSSVKCLQALVSAAIFLILVLLPVCLHAEEIVDYDFGYSLDVPEGYSVAEYTPDGMSYRFVHDRLPVSLILKLYTDGQFSESSAALSAVLSENETNTLTLRRGTETFTAQVTSVLCEGSYKAGMWVRDSAAGIGTVTFYTEDGKAFGALGHGICDADTRNVLEIRSGEPAAVSVCGIERGSSGRPGRLRGYFTGGKSLGTLTQNTELGLYGKLSAPHEGETVEVLPRGNVHTGAVQIAATIDDEGMRLFDAELERVSTDGKQETRTLVLHVTDPELLARTGGIVQGMSGCPILQDGKLVGAVTHVFVDDATRGYGIFAETMLENLNEN